MNNINNTKGYKNRLQEAFLDRILQKIRFNANTHNCLFTLRYNLQYKGEKLSEIAKIIKGDDKNKFFDKASINIVSKRVNDKILKIFEQEMEQDGIDVNSMINNPARGKPENSVSPYQITYEWLWTKKFPRMGWELVKKIASPAFEELNMIKIETSKRGLDLDSICIVGSMAEDDHDIKTKQPYHLHINLLIRDKYLLLINESVEGELYLISPSKAFADIPYTILSEDLYLPPDDNRKGRAKFFQYNTEGCEDFRAIVTEQPLELSWVRWESDPRDIILNQKRLEEIFIKIGQQSNSEVFYRLFKVVK